jgi:hypothetical protein
LPVVTCYEPLGYGRESTVRLSDEDMRILDEARR